MGQIQVTFHGVCTHFIGVVPGVPQRVVLPDATALRFGYVRTPAMEQAAYFVMPHFPILRMPDDGHLAINIPDVIDHGNITDGVHLQIANAIGPMNGIAAVQSGVPSLNAFVHDFTYSADVVTGGRASAYFDLLHAEGQKVMSTVDAAQQVVATIATDGPPVLRVTPFSGTASFDIPLPSSDAAPVALWVANQGMDCETKENSYDFLLHFLTAKMGIPRHLLRQPPGLSSSARTFSQETLDAAANKLKTLQYPLRFDTPCFTLQDSEDGQILITSAACSNSTYP